MEHEEMLHSKLMFGLNGNSATQINHLFVRSVSLSVIEFRTQKRVSKYLE